MNKYVFEILEEVGKQRNRNDKVKILKQHESWALKDVIRGSMDSTIVWNLPEGQPPYTPSPAHHHPANLIRENTKFKYFLKGGEGDRMPKVKREQIFIGILEGIRTGTTFANSITDLTYLFPVECDICLPLKFIISFVIIPTIGLDAI